MSDDPGDIHSLHVSPMVARVMVSFWRSVARHEDTRNDAERRDSALKMAQEWEMYCREREFDVRAEDFLPMLERKRARKADVQK